MSYIPSIRNIKHEGPFGKGEENGYFQGYLDDDSSTYLAGYDWCIEQVIKNLFFNLDIYQDELDECGVDEEKLEEFNQCYVNYLESDSFDLDSIKDSKVRLMLTLVKALEDYVESERDELGVSMIESLTQEEYEECKELYKAGYKNRVLAQDETLFKKS